MFGFKAKGRDRKTKELPQGYVVTLSQSSYDLVLEALEFYCFNVKQEIKHVEEKGVDNESFHQLRIAKRDAIKSLYVSMPNAVEKVEQLARENERQKIEIERLEKEVTSLRNLVDRLEDEITALQRGE